MIVAISVRDHHEMGIVVTSVRDYPKVIFSVSLASDVMSFLLCRLVAPSRTGSAPLREVIWVVTPSDDI